MDSWTRQQAAWAVACTAIVVAVAAAPTYFSLKPRVKRVTETKVAPVRDGMPAARLRAMFTGLETTAAKDARGVEFECAQAAGADWAVTGCWKVAPGRDS